MRASDANYNSLNNFRILIGGQLWTFSLRSYASICLFSWHRKSNICTQLWFAKTYCLFDTFAGSVLRLLCFCRNINAFRIIDNSKTGYVGFVQESVYHKNNARATVDIGNGDAKLIVRRIMKLKVGVVMATLNV